MAKKPSNRFMCVRGRLNDAVSDGEIEEALKVLASRKAQRDQLGLELDAMRGDSAEAMRLSKEAIENADIEKWAAYNNLLRRKQSDELQSRLSGFARISTFFYGTNTAENYGVKGSKESFEASWNEYRRRLAAGFYYDLEKGGLLSYVKAQDRNGKGVLDDMVAAEMYELRPGGKPGVSKNVEARKIAEILAKYNEEARLIQNSHGAFIRKIHGYIIAQSHDPLRISAAGAEKWANDIVDLLEDSNFAHLTMAPGSDADTVRAGRVRYLKKTWEELAKGKFGPDIEDDPALAAFKGPHNLARKVSKHRAFHFKGAEAFMRYNDLYGTGSLIEGYINGIEKAAQNAALLKTFGTNPRHEMQRLWENARNMAAAEGDQKTLNRLGTNFNKSEIGQLADLADGTADVPGHLGWARFGSSVRNIQSMASLGSAGLSSLFSDPLTAAVSLTYNGKNFFQSLTEQYGGVLKDFLVGGGTTREFAAMTGVAADAAIHILSTRLDAYGDYSHRFLKRWSNLFFKMNGLSGITASGERVMEAQLGGLLGLAAKYDLDAMPNRELARELTAYGVSKEEWDVLRQHALHDFNGYPMMVPLKVRDIDEDVIAKLARTMNLGDNPSKRLIARVRSDLQNKIGGYLASETYNGILRLGLHERQLLTAGTQAGTRLGETVRFVGQFKGFPTAVITRILGRMVREDKLTSIFDQLGRHAASGLTLGAYRFGAQGDGRMLGGYLVTMMGLGYISLTASDFFKGQTPRDPTEVRTAMASMLKGGGLGLYGDYLFGQYNHAGTDALDSIAGPTLSDIGRVTDMTYKLREATLGNADFPDTEIANLIVNNTPGVNLFYTRSALNYLFLYDLQEALAPGTLRRIERRADRDRGQEFFFNPSENRLRPFTGDY